MGEYGRGVAHDPASTAATSATNVNFSVVAPGATEPLPHEQTSMPVQEDGSYHGPRHWKVIMRCGQPHTASSATHGSCLPKAARQRRGKGGQGPSRGGPVFTSSLQPHQEKRRARGALTRRVLSTVRKAIDVDLFKEMLDAFEHCIAHMQLMLAACIATFAFGYISK